MRLALLATTLMLVACSSSGKAPALASSARHTTYAIRYVDEVATSTKTVAEAQSEGKTLTAGLPARTDELKKPDWDKVSSVIDDSDEAGRSADFADGHADVDVVRAFWERDKDIITGKTVGSAQHTLKEASCTAEVAGPVAYALNEAVQKQLQRRLRARNQAYVTIERYKGSLGQQNVAALEKLADDISQASYDVNVSMVVHRERLHRLAADKTDVKKTLDRLIREETAYQAEPGRTDAEKKTSNDRITAANKAKAEVDAAGAQAEKLAKQTDATVDTAKNNYDRALKDLRAKVAEKKKAEPAARGAANTPPSYGTVTGTATEKSIARSRRARASRSSVSVERSSLPEKL